MIRRKKIPDPIPPLHRLFRKTDRLVDPMSPENRGTKRKGFRKYFLVLISVIITAQVLFVLVLPRGNREGVTPAYRSEETFLGIPLYAQGRIPVAWVAVGGLPIGFVAVGGVSIGVFSLGGLSLGVFSLGGLALALFAIGGGAIGLLGAMGGAAAGYYAFGGLAVGGIAYAGNGVARGYYLASGRQSERLMGGEEPKQPDGP